MKIGSFRYIFFLVGTIIFFTGCKRDPFSWGIQVGDLVYSENVVFMGHEELVLIDEITENTISFNGSTSVTDKLTGESIIIAGVSEKTPLGLLRNVSSIQRNGSRVTVGTTEAMLTDAVKEGTIKFEKVLLEKDFVLKSISDGVKLNGSGKAFDGIAVTLEDFELYKSGTTVALLSGAVGISPRINFSARFNAAKASEINTYSVMEKIDELTVISNGSFNGSDEKVLAEFVHTPVTIDSLVFVPEVNLVCGFSGSVSSQVSAGVRQDRTITSKMNFMNNSWVDDPLAYSENYDYVLPEITDNSDLKIFSGPEITLKIFGIPIEEIKATGYFSLQADKTSTPFWRLYVGSEGQNSILSEQFGLNSNHNSSLTIPASEIVNSNGKR